MSRTKQPCGCNPQHNGDGNWFLEWCPLHANAPALVEALQNLLELTTQICNAPGGYAFAQKLPEWWDGEQLERAKQALAHAEGRT